MIKHWRGRNEFLHTSISVYLRVIRDKIRAQVLSTASRVAKFVLQNFIWSRIININHPMVVTLPHWWMLQGFKCSSNVRV